MKKIFLIAAAVFLLVTSCNKRSTRENDPLTDKAAMKTERRCATYEVLQQQLQDDPGLQQRMDKIEEFTHRFQTNKDNAKLLPDGTLEVPVVVNVLYRTAAENISENQVKSQIDVLNADFSGSNGDANKTPSIFESVRAGNIKITFKLVAINRKQTNVISWSTNNAMKKSNQGGIDATAPATTLNIWVCTIGGGILGYAQFPGGNSSTDGVVILNEAFGKVGTAADPYDKGRTATHEIGHYFNLRHIWGDRKCGDDYVDDTPLHNSYNFGCPSFPDNSDCGGAVHPMMTMNYMDYTDDACMYMFTAGQKTRIQATYSIGGPRAGLRR